MEHTLSHQSVRLGVPAVQYETPFSVRRHVMGEGHGDDSTIDRLADAIVNVYRNCVVPVEKGKGMTEEAFAATTSTTSPLSRPSHPTHSLPSPATTEVKEEEEEGEGEEGGLGWSAPPTTLPYVASGKVAKAMLADIAILGPQDCSRQI